MKFEIDLGNTNIWVIGMVMVVEADSPEAALERARDLIPEYFEMDRRGLNFPDENFTLYFNPNNITLDDIQEADE